MSVGVRHLGCLGVLWLGDVFQVVVAEGFFALLVVEVQHVEAVEFVLIGLGCLVPMEEVAILWWRNGWVIWVSTVQSAVVVALAVSAWWCLTLMFLRPWVETANAPLDVLDFLLSGFSIPFIKAWAMNDQVLIVGGWAERTRVFSRVHFCCGCCFLRDRSVVSRVLALAFVVVLVVVSVVSLVLSSARVGLVRVHIVYWCLRLH